MPFMDEATSASEPSDPPSLSLVHSPLSAAQILEATARCLREEGYDATTIRRIAGRLGCAVGSIYRYYTDKRQLLEAVAQAALEPAAQVVETGGSVEDSAALYCRIAASDPALYRMMFWLSALGAESVLNQPPRIIERILEGWSKRLGDESAARAAWITLHGSAMLGVEHEATLSAVRASLNHATVRLAPQIGRAAHVAEVSPHIPSEPVLLITKPPRRARAVAATQPAEPDRVEDVVLL